MRQKFTARLVSKELVTDTVLELAFSVPMNLGFVPGQFMNISVTYPFRRPYSIVDISEGKAKFLIKISEPGKGADFFQQMKVGEETEMIGPQGRYALQETNLYKIFIATGVGVAPFIPMIRSLLDPVDKKNIQSELWLGTRSVKEEILASRYLSEQIHNENNFQFTRSVTQPESDELEFFHGRVNSLIERRSKDLDFDNTEFYVCGGNEMVKGVRDQLKTLGAKNIFIENWG